MLNLVDGLQLAVSFTVQLAVINGRLEAVGLFWQSYALDPDKVVGGFIVVVMGTRQEISELEICMFGVPSQQGQLGAITYG